MRVLRNRNFSILLSGQLVSKIGNNLYGIALPWFVYAVTNSKADLALTGFATVLPGILGLLSGVYVDRWFKKRTMIWSDIIRFLLTMALFLIAFYHGWIVWMIGLVLLMEVVGTVFGPASTALIPMVVPEQEITDAMGMSQTSSSTAGIVGALGGGALITLLGAPLLFLFNAISFLGSVISLFFVRVQETKPESRAQKNFVREWKEGIAVILRSKLILLITLAAVLANFGFSVIDILTIAWVKGPLHSNALWLSLAQVGLLVGNLVSGVTLAMISKRVPLKKLLLVGLILMGCLVGAVWVIKSPIWVACDFLVAGYVMGTVNGTLMSMLVKVVPATMRGRVFGTLSALCTAASPLGVLIFGGLMVAISLPVLFVIIGGLSILSGLSFLLPIKDDVQNMQQSIEEVPIGV